MSRSPGPRVRGRPERGWKQGQCGFSQEQRMSIHYRSVGILLLLWVTQALPGGAGQHVNVSAVAPTGPELPAGAACADELRPRPSSEVLCERTTFVPRPSRQELAVFRQLETTRNQEQRGIYGLSAVTVPPGGWEV